MGAQWTIQEIAHIESDFSEKFGIPRQSGLVEELRARIVFDPAFRDENAVRGLAEFSHIWLIWGFSANAGRWSATVKPPRLGGNTRIGVFATRSPFRPNSLGLSCVRLLRVEPQTPQGPVLHVAGADLLDGTPIWDIKPYLPYVDALPQARGGFTDQSQWRQLQVVLPDPADSPLSEAETLALRQALALDPRPHYHNDPTRLYGLAFADYDVRFRVEGDQLTVVEIVEGKGAQPKKT